VIGIWSDAFGSNSPYLAFFIAGSATATSIIVFKKYS
jgi:hypothetical protein